MDSATREKLARVMWQIDGFHLDNWDAKPNYFAQEKQNYRKKADAIRAKED